MKRSKHGEDSSTFLDFQYAHELRAGIASCSCLYSLPASMHELPCRRESWLHVLGTPPSLGCSGLPVLALGVHKASFQVSQVRLCKFKPQSLTPKPFEENLCCGSRATFLDGRQLYVDAMRRILLVFRSRGFETLEDLALGRGALGRLRFAGVFEWLR